MPTNHGEQTEALAEDLDGQDAVLSTGSIGCILFGKLAGELTRQAGGSTSEVFLTSSPFSVLGVSLNALREYCHDRNLDDILISQVVELGIGRWLPHYTTVKETAAVAAHVGMTSAAVREEAIRQNLASDAPLQSEFSDWMYEHNLGRATQFAGENVHRFLTWVSTTIGEGMSQTYTSTRQFIHDAVNRLASEINSAEGCKDTKQIQRLFKSHVQDQCSQHRWDSEVTAAYSELLELHFGPRLFTNELGNIGVISFTVRPTSSPLNDERVSSSLANWHKDIFSGNFELPGTVFVTRATDDPIAKKLADKCDTMHTIKEMLSNLYLSECDSMPPEISDQLSSLASHLGSFEVEDDKPVLETREGTDTTSHEGIKDAKDICLGLGQLLDPLATISNNRGLKVASATLISGSSILGGCEALSVAAGLSKALACMSIVTGVLNIATLFMGHDNDRNTEAAIFSQLAAIREEISALREELREQIQGVHEHLDNMLDTLLQAVTRIQSNLKSIREELSTFSLRTSRSFQHILSGQSTILMQQILLGYNQTLNEVNDLKRERDALLIGSVRRDPTQSSDSAFAIIQGANDLGVNGYSLFQAFESPQTIWNHLLSSNCLGTFPKFAQLALFKLARKTLPEGNNDVINPLLWLESTELYIFFLNRFWFQQESVGQCLQLAVSGGLDYLEFIKNLKETAYMLLTPLLKEYQRVISLITAEYRSQLSSVTDELLEDHAEKLKAKLLTRINKRARSVQGVLNTQYNRVKQQINTQLREGMGPERPNTLPPFMPPQISLEELIIGNRYIIAPTNIHNNCLMPILSPLSPFDALFSSDSASREFWQSCLDHKLVTIDQQYSVDMKVLNQSFTHYGRCEYHANFPKRTRQIEDHQITVSVFATLPAKERIKIGEYVLKLPKHTLSTEQTYDSWSGGRHTNPHTLFFQIDNLKKEQFHFKVEHLAKGALDIFESHIVVPRFINWVLSSGRFELAPKQALLEESSINRTESILREAHRLKLKELKQKVVDRLVTRNSISEKIGLIGNLSDYLTHWQILHKTLKLISELFGQSNANSQLRGELSTLGETVDNFPTNFAANPDETIEKLDQCDFVARLQPLFEADFEHLSETKTEKEVRSRIRNLCRLASEYLPETAAERTEFLDHARAAQVSLNNYHMGRATNASELPAPVLPPNYHLISHARGPMPNTRIFPRQLDQEAFMRQVRQSIAQGVQAELARLLGGYRLSTHPIRPSLVLGSTRRFSFFTQNAAASSEATSDIELMQAVAEALDQVYPEDSENSDAREYRQSVLDMLSQHSDRQLRPVQRAQFQGILSDLAGQQQTLTLRNT